MGFSYNPASQIKSNERSNDLYSIASKSGVTISSPANGLNQLRSHNGVTLSYDAKGNLTKHPSNGYTLGYSSENLLTTVNGGAWIGTLKYDPLMRLYESGVNSSTRFVYDGMDRIAEYSSSGAQVARYVHGPGIDEPLIEMADRALPPAPSFMPTSAARSSPARTTAAR